MEEETEEREDVQLESKVDVLRVECCPSTSNTCGQVKSGSFIELRDRMIRAVMESDASERACVRREGFGAQVVHPDCRTTCLSKATDSREYRYMQRAYSDCKSGGQVDNSITPDGNNVAEHNGLDQNHWSDEAAQDSGSRTYGVVYCLLLYTARYQDELQPCVLILGKLPNEDNICYQRLGLAHGHLEGLDHSSYRLRKKWPLWKEWEDLEEWENWKNWFADAKLETVKIM